MDTSVVAIVTMFLSQEKQPPFHQCNVCGAGNCQHALCTLLGQSSSHPAYLVGAVEVWHHRVEHSGDLGPIVVVHHSQQAGWNGAVEVGHHQHRLRHREHLTAAMDERLAFDVVLCESFPREYKITRNTNDIMND